MPAAIPLASRAPVARSTFTWRSPMGASPEEVIAWHLRPGALQRLIPPFDDVRVLESDPVVTEGSRTLLSVGLGPLRRRWLAEHRDVLPGSGFRDVQVAGPFRHWEHSHLAEAAEGGALLVDRIEYELPLGPLGRLVGERMLRAQLRRTFSYRHRTTARDLLRHRQAGSRPLRILVSGASGLLGSTLVPFLTTGGHEVLRLVRREPRAPDEIAWDGAGHLGDDPRLEDLDGTVHLAGANVAAGRWTAARKTAIRDSRLVGTAGLCEALGRLKRPPRVLVSASAVGFYGDRGESVLDEDASPGKGFLASTAQAWESAATSLARTGARVVTARFGVVLSPRGGALGRLLLPFRLGLGGPLGSGRQWVSWIGIDDAVAALLQLLVRDELTGPVNVVAPAPVTFAELARTLGHVLRRPALLPLPAPVTRLALGEMAQEMLLSSQRVRPAALERAGFRFDEPRLEGALRHLLGRRT